MAPGKSFQRERGLPRPQVLFYRLSKNQHSPVEEARWESIDLVPCLLFVGFVHVQGLRQNNNATACSSGVSRTRMRLIASHRRP